MRNIGVLAQFETPKTIVSTNSTLRNEPVMLKVSFRRGKLNAVFRSSTVQTQRLQITKDAKGVSGKECTVHL